MIIKNDYSKLLGIIHSILQKEKVDTKELQNAINLFEENFEREAEKHGFDMNSRDKRFERIEEFRKKELENLEKKAKTKNNTFDIREQTKEIMAKIKQFWSDEDFGLTGEMFIGKTGIVNVEFSFHGLFWSRGTENKVSKEEKIQKFIKEGYLLTEGNSNLIDCDTNKELIKKLITDKYPSALLTKWESSLEDPRTGNFILKNCFVKIKKIEDVI